MANGGFRAPVQQWGINAPGASVQGGYRSPACPWLGGASAPVVTTTKAGFRSWMGAFWMGGACARVQYVPPVPPMDDDDDGGNRRNDPDWRSPSDGIRNRIFDEDEEFTQFLPAFLRIL